MTLFGLVIISILIMYAGFMIYLLSGLFRLSNTSIPKPPFEPTVSVVVAARNEQDNLECLLEDLCRQTYPKNKYQIIITLTINVII